MWIGLDGCFLSKLDREAMGSRTMPRNLHQVQAVAALFFVSPSARFEPQIISSWKMMAFAYGPVFSFLGTGSRGVGGHSEMVTV